MATLACLLVFFSFSHSLHVWESEAQLSRYSQLLMENLVIIFSSLPLLHACFTCSSSCSSSPETGFPSIDVREGSLPTLQNQEHLISIHPHILPRLHGAERLLFLVSPLLTTISLLPALFPSSLDLSHHPPLPRAESRENLRGWNRLSLSVKPQAHIDK